MGKRENRTDPKMQKTISKQGSVQSVYIDRLNIDLKQNMIKRKMEDIKTELTKMKNTIS